MARKRANLTDLLNDLTARVLYDKYKLVALNGYEWGGLPEGIEERHIEGPLFHGGKAAFFERKGGSFMCLRADDCGRINVYGDPTGYRVTGVGYSELLDVDDMALVENNKLRLPTEPFIMHYINKLVEAERTMDVNLKACKTPIIFACDDKDVLSFKRMFQQVDGNVPACFVDTRLNLDSITAFKTGVTFMGNELMDYKRAVESDLLTFLGQNNMAVEKRERLITDEANANNQLIDSFADLQLEARQRAADAINAKYGLHVTVKRRGVENAVETVEKEDVENEPV